MRYWALAAVHFSLRFGPWPSHPPVCCRSPCVHGLRQPESQSALPADLPRHREWLREIWPVVRQLGDRPCGQPPMAWKVTPARIANVIQ